MVTKKSTIQILNEAADIIERDGWVAHERHASNGSVCAIGALERAATGENYTRAYGGSNYTIAENSCPEAMTALAAMALNPFGYTHKGAAIAGWSNSHTAADGAKKVACVMRAAAAYLEEEAKNASA